jgi:hypothetical protein
MRRLRRPRPRGGKHGPEVQRRGAPASWCLGRGGGPLAAAVEARSRREAQTTRSEVVCGGAFACGEQGSRAAGTTAQGEHSARPDLLTSQQL